MIPRYFLWRLTDREPWRVGNLDSFSKLIQCQASADDIIGEYAEWRGDDYQEAREECRKLNAERKEALEGGREAGRDGVG